MLLRPLSFKVFMWTLRFLILNDGGYYMLYENVYTMNGKMVTDYVVRILCRHIIMFGAVLIAVGLGMMIYVGGFQPLFFSVVFSGICCGIILPLIINSRYKQAFASSGNSKKDQTRIRFRDRNITMDNPQGHMNITYDQIERIRKTKYFYVLDTKNKSSLLVYKDGFVKGNPHSFYDFIKAIVPKEK